MVVLIDTSGSLGNAVGDDDDDDSGPSRLELVIAELIDSINALNADQRCNVVRFSSDAQYVGDLVLMEATDANKRAMINALTGISAGGGTNYDRGFAAVLELDPAPDQIVFLTDGRPNNQNYLDGVQQIADGGTKIDSISVEPSGQNLERIETVSTFSGGTLIRLSSAFPFPSPPKAISPLEKPRPFTLRDGSRFPPSEANSA